MGFTPFSPTYEVLCRRSSTNGVQVTSIKLGFTLFSPTCNLHITWTIRCVRGR